MPPQDHVTFLEPLPCARALYLLERTRNSRRQLVCLYLLNFVCIPINFLRSKAHGKKILHPPLVYVYIQRSEGTQQQRNVHYKRPNLVRLIVVYKKLDHASGSKLTKTKKKLPH